VLAFYLETPIIPEGFRQEFAYVYKMTTDFTNDAENNRVAIACGSIDCLSNGFKGPECHKTNTLLTISLADSLLFCIPGQKSRSAAMKLFSI
jgi:hypothetical protein